MPERSVSGRSGQQRQAAAEPDERSRDDGGLDGRDEGECGHDGAADADYGMDQRVLLWLCHK